MAVARLDASAVAHHDRARWARQVAAYDRQLTRLTVNLAELVPAAVYAEARESTSGGPRVSGWSSCRCGSPGR